MKRYSPERKEAVLAMMLPPHNHSVRQVALQEGITHNTLYEWRNKAGISGSSTAVQQPGDWTEEARFAVIVETAPSFRPCCC